MKKIMLLAIVFASFSSAYSMDKDTCACPTATVRYKEPIKDIAYNPIPTRRIYTPSKPSARSIQNSFNVTITTNNYNYPANPVPVVRESRPIGYGYSDDSWLVPFLFFLMLAGLIAWLLYSRQTPVAPSPVNVHVPPAPPAPRPIVVAPPSSDELDQAINKAASVGGTFMRSKDGSYTIDFPKPPMEEKKEGIDQTRKDQSGVGGGDTMG